MIKTSVAWFAVSCLVAGCASKPPTGSAAAPAESAQPTEPPKSDGPGPAASAEPETPAPPKELKAGGTDPVADEDAVLAVHEGLERLARLSPRQAQVVELRTFAGMSVEETAAALGVSTRTVEVDWRLARAWLSRELAHADG